MESERTRKTIKNNRNEKKQSIQLGGGCRGNDGFVRGVVQPVREGERGRYAADSRGSFQW